MRLAAIPLLLSACLLVAGCSTTNTRAKRCCNSCCNAPAAVTYSEPAPAAPAPVVIEQPAPAPAPAPAPLPPRRDRN